VVELTDQRWLSLVESQSHATIFQHPSWARALADTYGYRAFAIVATDAAGHVYAGLPMMEVASPLTGRRWISLPFTDHCNPVLRDDSALKDLPAALKELRRSSGIPRVELRFCLPPHPGLQSSQAYTLHEVELSEDVEAVYQQIHKMHRRNVRIAENEGVRIEWGTEQRHAHDYYALHLHTRRRQGVPIQPRRFFDQIAELLQQGLGFILLAHHEGHCVAGAVFLHWRDTLTYKYGASLPDNRKLRPNNLVMWTAIRWGCQHGFRVFDLGRTDTSNLGLREFKTRWGARETPLSYSVITTQPPKPDHNGLERFMTTAIRSSPTWVCRVTGELLYKHFA
jgi:CelD/BcsL family acetyltransferase involved in cellulose biosynthesis